MQATIVKPEPALRDYNARMRCVEPATDGYAHSTRIWNGAVQHKPALVARCLTTDDIQLSLTMVEVTSDGNT